MSLEQDIKDLMGLWHNTEARLKISLANIWIDREEGKLKLIEIEAHKVESEALRLLRAIHDRKDEDDLHKHMKEFLSLIHHVKPTRPWQEEVQKELNAIVRDSIIAARERAREIAVERQQAWRQKVSQAPQSRIVQTVKSAPQPIDARIELITYRGEPFGFLEGRFEFNGQIIFKLIKISLIGQITRAELREIASQVGIFEEINKEFHKCSRSDNPINISIVLDFGDSFPVAKIPWGNYIDPVKKTFHVPPPPLQFGVSLIPKIELLVSNIRIDLNTRPLTLVVNANPSQIAGAELQRQPEDLAKYYTEGMGLRELQQVFMHRMQRAESSNKIVSYFEDFFRKDAARNGFLPPTFEVKQWNIPMIAVTGENNTGTLLIPLISGIRDITRFIDKVHVAGAYSDSCRCYEMAANTRDRGDMAEAEKLERPCIAKLECGKIKRIIMIGVVGN